MDCDGIEDSTNEGRLEYDGMCEQDGETGEVFSNKDDHFDMELEASAAIAYVLGKMSNP